jgi:hypothetical protein
MEQYDFLDKNKVFQESYISKEMQMWKTKTNKIEENEEQPTESLNDNFYPNGVEAHNLKWYGGFFE